MKEKKLHQRITVISTDGTTGILKSALDGKNQNRDRANTNTHQQQKKQEIGMSLCVVDKGCALKSIFG